MARSVAVLALLAFAAFANAQNATMLNNFMFMKPEFEADLLEAKQREESNYTGFVFGFANANASDMTPNGMLQANQVNTNPFLSTLPGDGNGQTLVTMGPCAGNTPHTHPRGSEISTLLYGNITFGMVEENAAENKLVLRSMNPLETIHIPTGILHFSHNDNCEPAAFLANFATRDPGTQTTWKSLTMIPNDILNAGTGISEDDWTSLKMNYPLVTAPGTGGSECLKRCGLDFTTSNKLTPVENPSSVASDYSDMMLMTAGRK